MSRLIRSIRFDGVFAGARTPNQLLDSKPGMTDSLIVGTVGIPTKRARLVIANAFSLPEAMLGSTAAPFTNATCVSAPSTAVIAAPEPLYGTFRISSLRVEQNNHIAS